MSAGVYGSGPGASGLPRSVIPRSVRGDGWARLTRRRKLHARTTRPHAPSGTSSAPASRACCSSGAAPMFCGAPATPSGCRPAACVSTRLAHSLCPNPAAGACMPSATSRYLRRKHIKRSCWHRSRSSGREARRRPPLLHPRQSRMQRLARQCPFLAASPTPRSLGLQCRQAEDGGLD